MPTVHVGDIDLYYEVRGAGPAVAFAHGAGGNHLSWWQQIPAFAREFTCITFDHRAFGRSHDHPDNGRGRAAFADDLAALLDHLGIERAAVVAQSMGGRTAAGFTLRHPGRTWALVFAGTHGGVVNDASREAQQRHRERMRGRPLAARALGPDFAEREPALAFLYRQIAALNPPRPGDFLAPLPAQRPHSTTASLHATGVPVIFLVGEHDAVVPPEVMRIAHEELAGSRFVEIADCGHSTYFERPSAFNRAVLAFLREAWAAELQGAAAPGRAERR